MCRRGDNHVFHVADESISQRDEGRQGRRANELSLETGDYDATPFIAQPFRDNPWVESRGAFGQLAEQPDECRGELGRLVCCEGANMDRHGETVAAEGSLRG